MENISALVHIKNHISYHLDQIIEEAVIMKNSLGEKDYCLLCELSNIRERFDEIQSSASFFYLKAYIAEFTKNYIEIAKALQNLSNRRHGALIIVERLDSTGSKIHGGIQINADLSSRLIESIFYPGNPLHDGALLISGDVIHSAANVLPLTTQHFGSEKIGTRHRAAIGLSDQTDALILVVSEETGKMSFALEGTLYPISSSNTNLQ
ncbi:sporulation-specific diadenylate cyclase CdaS [Metabacillus litoralis]|uniref:sporulation-specific diadenylate cyclase CdaS n=1 Tax=Metabacillus litoralis TaxID=152268 RepID=UPI001CFF3089|nr:sporulation-specific diadenylate cyclase CdaS [Metabacillus litoralis]